jgi:glucose-1-phosphate cytidylyltransferase
MAYYSHFGHKDFILCLGYKAYLSSDYIMSEGGRNVQILDSDIADWRITFVDTGLYSNIGQRLEKVRRFVEGEEMFLANYSDVLTDLHLPLLIDSFVKSKKIGCFLSVKPPYSFHIVTTKKDGLVKQIRDIGQSNIRINGGFFVFRKEIFKYLNEGEDLVIGSFQSLIDKEELVAYEHDGFWACMDTFKEKQRLDELCGKGLAPWEVWKSPEKERNRGGR